MKTRKKFYLSTHVAGRQYHEDDVWDKLKVGTELRLVYDADNRHDENAVALVFDDEQDGEFLIGYVPRAHNETIALLLEMGWSDVFECRISGVNEDVHYEQQLKITIKIRRKVEA